MNCNYKVKITDIQNKYQFKILCKGGANSTNVNDIYNLLPTTTSESTIISISNTADIKAKSITIKGNTTQDGTPTPASPVDVLNVTGLNTIKVGNQNLIDKVNFTPSGTYTDVTITNNNDGTLTLNGTTTANRSYIISPNPNYYNEEQLGTYSYKCFGLPSACYTNIYYGSNVNGEDVYNLNVNTANRNYAMILVIPSGTTLSNVTIKPMLVKGSYTSSNYPNYEPHIEKDFIINFGDLEFCKIGNYQDYPFKENNKWYKHNAVGKKRITTVTRNTTENANYFRWFADLTNSIQCDTTHAGAYMNISKIIDAGKTFNCVDGITITNSNVLCLYSDDLKEYTLEEMTTYLSQNQILLYYPLATPTITEITDTTLIKQLNNISNNIRTFEGGTNISSTSAGANPIINITTFNKLS